MYQASLNIQPDIWQFWFVPGKNFTSRIVVTYKGSMRSYTLSDMQDTGCASKTVEINNSWLDATGELESFSKLNLPSSRHAYDECYSRGQHSSTASTSLRVFFIRAVNGNAGIWMHESDTWHVWRGYGCHRNWEDTSQSARPGSHSARHCRLLYQYEEWRIAPKHQTHWCFTPA